MDLGPVSYKDLAKNIFVDTNECPPSNTSKRIPDTQTDEKGDRLRLGNERYSRDRKKVYFYRDHCIHI